MVCTRCGFKQDCDDAERDVWGRVSAHARGRVIDADLCPECCVGLIDWYDDRPEPAWEDVLNAG